MIAEKSSQFRISFFVALFAVCGVALAGCSVETEEDQKISSALACIDTATTSTEADSCSAKVQGIQTSKAALIRCSADFIAQGLTGSRLASAFQQQNNSGGTSNATTSMAAYLVFSPSLTGHTASDTVTHCNQSGIQSVMGLAALVQVATTIATISGSLPASLDPSNPQFDKSAILTQINTLISNLNSNDPTTQANAAAQASAIGSAAVTAQTSFCSAGSTLSTQDVCTKLNSAISGGGGDSSNIGKSLLNLLKQ